MKYVLNDKEIDTCMIGTWAWGTGSNGGKIVFGKNYDEQQLNETFETAYNIGFDFWDTAEVYGMGTAELLLGGFIRDKEVTVSTKHFPNKKYKEGENRTAVEGSLQRLGIDKIDLYWLHAPKNIEENMKELAQLKKEGLIGSVGISNADLEQIRLAEITLSANGVSLAAVQNHYSLLTIEREAEALNYCKSKNIIFFGYMILEQGALSGTYDEKNHFPLFSMRGMSFSKGKFRKIQGLIDYIRELGGKYGIAPAQIPIAWAVSKGVIPIVGLTKPDHATSLNSGLTTILSAAEIKKLEELALSSGVKCKGMWE